MLYVVTCMMGEVCQTIGMLFGNYISLVVFHMVTVDVPQALCSLTTWSAHASVQLRPAFRRFYSAASSCKCRRYDGTWSPSCICHIFGTHSSRWCWPRTAMSDVRERLARTLSKRSANQPIRFSWLARWCRTSTLRRRMQTHSAPYSELMHNASKVISWPTCNLVPSLLRSSQVSSTAQLTILVSTTTTTTTTTQRWATITMTTTTELRSRWQQSGNQSNRLEFSSNCVSFSPRIELPRDDAKFEESSYVLSYYSLKEDALIPNIITLIAMIITLKTVTYYILLRKTRL